MAWSWSYKLQLWTNLAYRITNIKSLLRSSTDPWFVFLKALFIIKKNRKIVMYLKLFAAFCFLGDLFWSLCWIFHLQKKQNHYVWRTQERIQWKFYEDTSLKMIKRPFICIALYWFLILWFKSKLIFE